MLMLENKTGAGKDAWEVSREGNDGVEARHGARHSYFNVHSTDCCFLSLPMH